MQPSMSSMIEMPKPVYVDDTLEHIESARTLGIRAFHLAPPLRINDVL